MAGGSADGASVTGRALSLLAAFDAEHPTRGLAELGRVTGLASSTAHRLVGELVAWGALERTDDGRYRIGLRLWEVASLAPLSRRLRESAMPFLTDLAEVTQQNVQLAVREGRSAVYVERLAARGAVPVISRPGGRLPLHATGVGLVLLAHAPAEVQDAVLAGPLAAMSPMTVTDPAEVRRRLAQVRAQGWCRSDRQVELTTQSVAAPVRDGAAVVAAVSLVVPADHDAFALVPTIRAAAAGISRALGTPHPLTP